jgi:hypothetical protein
LLTVVLALGAERFWLTGKYALDCWGKGAAGLVLVLIVFIALPNEAVRVQGIVDYLGMDCRYSLYS